MPLSCSGWSPPPRLRPGPPVSYAATSSSTWVCRRQVLYLGTEAAEKPPWGVEVIRVTMRSGWGNARGLSSTVLTTEKMAVFAPIPSASADIAVAVKPGLWRSRRKACFTSNQKVSINRLDAAAWRMYCILQISRLSAPVLPPRIPERREKNRHTAGDRVGRGLPALHQPDPDRAQRGIQHRILHCFRLVFRGPFYVIDDLNISRGPYAVTRKGIWR